MKKEKGITMVALAITIVIILILVSVTMYYATPVIQNAQLQNLNTNMLLIQAKAKTVGENARFNNDSTQYIGQKLSEMELNEEISNLVSKGIIDTSNNVYLLTQSDLAKMGLDNIDYDLGYIVNYDSDEIIYVKGFEYKDNTYYRLSEMKALTIEM